MTLAGDPLGPLIIDAGALKADQRHHAAQEDVDLLEVGKLAQRPAAHQPIIGMVEDDLRAQPVHQMVKALGSKPLEKGVGVPLGTHAVDDLAARPDRRRSSRPSR